MEPLTVVFTILSALIVVAFAAIYFIEKKTERKKQN